MLQPRLNNNARVYQKPSPDQNQPISIHRFCWLINFVVSNPDVKRYDCHCLNKVNKVVNKKIVVSNKLNNNYLRRYEITYDKILNHEVVDT